MDKRNRYGYPRLDLYDSTYSEQKTYVWNRMMTTLCVLLFVVLPVILHSCSASAKPPKNANPEWAAWFESLRQPKTNYSCCGMGDCRIVPDDHWRTNGKNYQVLFDKKWVDIPQDIVLHRDDNPTGHAVLCVGAYETGIVLYCFTVPPMA